ncbi:MAG: amidohydrolase family protein [Candidatus Hodarchaeota archaeon]
MIFDMHVHLGRHEPYGPYEKIEWVPPTSMFGPKEYIELMDKFGIQKAAIMSTKQTGDLTKVNEEIAQWARQYPKRFIGCAIMYPGGPNAPDELERLVKLGIRYLKLHPYAQNYLPYLPFVHPLMERAIKLKIPVVIHSGTPPTSTPLQIAMLADYFPEATIVMAHMGISATWAADARFAAKKHDNIILETSDIPAVRVKTAYNALGPERIIYGSDLPYSILEWDVQKIKSLHLPKRDEEMIMWENANKLFP